MSPKFIAALLATAVLLTGPWTSAFGRKVASQQGYPYSEALKARKISCGTRPPSIVG